jgi:predicted DNA-binding protein with PD1-like motif
MKLLKFDSYLVVRLEKDEEVITALTQALSSAHIKGGFFYGLGVGKALELGYFDAHKQAYIKKEFPDEYEFTSFLGNVSMVNDEITIHCHVTITDAQFNAYGGHLFHGTVPATLEVIVFPFTEPLTRKKDRATGLNLLEL